MKYIGIDPGKNGGIAILNDNGELLIHKKMPATPHDLLTFLNEEKEDAICYLEKVNSRIGNGAKAMFTFGQGYGHLEMALLATNISTTTVTPQKWEKFYQLGTSTNHSKTEWKNKLKFKAQQLFPLAKNITLSTADAILIAYYARQNHKQP